MSSKFADKVFLTGCDEKTEWQLESLEPQRELTPINFYQIVF